MISEVLKKVVAGKQGEGVPKSVILNYLREYIQYLVLELIYNKKEFKEMVFKGGSCLRICYDLPRLSEDLDFDCLPAGRQGGGNINDLEKYLNSEIKSKYYPKLETKLQEERRIYLKLPILKETGIASGLESDKLYVKVEVDEKEYKNAKTELTPVSKFGFNFVAKHNDLPSLMAGKIHAIFYRLWRKSEVIDVKGRDFYDLYWFLKNNVKPNMRMVKEMTGIKSEAELIKELKKRVNLITPEKISYDLKNFISEEEFVKDFARNYQDVVGRMLEI